MQKESDNLEYKSSSQDITFYGQQSTAILTTDRNVIVSASAGSGKTTAMIERITRLIEKEKVAVREILVVTFVNAAAGDIKEKLYLALKKCYENTNDKFLETQLNHIPISSISTLHSFCNDLVKTYFYKLGLSPSYKILSGDDAVLFSNQAITATLDKVYEEDNQTLQELLRMFKGNRTDKTLKEIILSLYEFVYIQPYPLEYFDNVIIGNYKDDDRIKNLLTQYNAIIKREICMYKKAFEVIYGQLDLHNMKENASACSGILSLIKTIEKSDNLSTTINAINNFETLRISRKGLKGSDLQANNVYGEYKNLRYKFNKCVKIKFKKLIPATTQEYITLSKNNLKYIEMFKRLVFDYAEEFMRIKNQKGVLDFSDLEHYTIELLQDGEIVKELQAKYRYIFVDEYQDINPVQEYILSKITRGDNMFMVGDIKQSVYSFRLCTPEVFLNKYNSYKNGNGGLALEFNKNFRSNSYILDFVNIVFNTLMLESTGGINYKNNSQLIAGKDISTISHCPAVDIINIQTDNFSKEFTPEVYSVLNDNTVKTKDKSYYEANEIASLIMNMVGKKKIYDSKNPDGRYVKYSDIVILLRKKTGSYQKLIKNLQETYIPISTETDSNLTAEILILIDLLKILDNRKIDISLAAVMRSHLANFSDNELAEVRIFNNNRKLAFYEAILDYAKNNDNGLSKKLNEFLAFLDFYTNTLKSKSVSDVLLEIVSATCYDGYVLSLKNGSSRFNKINRFILNISHSIYNYDLYSFLLNINDIEEKLTSQSATIDDNDCVKIMTIHKSKGLEFPIVIFAGAGGSIGGKMDEILLSSDLGIGMDWVDFDKRCPVHTVNNELIKYQKTVKQAFEELRILYVCLTRAQNHLIITGINGENIEDVDINEVSLLDFKSYLGLILYSISKIPAKDLLAMKVEYRIIPFDMLLPSDSEQKPLVFLPDTTADCDDLISILNKQYKYLESTVTPQKFSVTALSQSLDNNNIFESENIDKDAKILITEDVAERGILQHLVLENIDIFGKNEDIDNVISQLVENQIISAEQVVMIDKDAIKNVINNKFIKSLADYEIYRELPFIMKIAASKVLDTDNEDEVMVQGQIDLLAFKDNEIVLVDFKNSSISNADVLKTRYGKQLGIYAEACRLAFGAKSIKIKKYIYNILRNMIIEV